ncbi:signal peptidase I [Patescibacteria group bacterium]|nr:signal peptidase I [Candidatus Dojkabacteria bacterium]CAG1023133.1 signal peptidase I [Patescibacteria group bacterium]
MDEEILQENLTVPVLGFNVPIEVYDFFRTAGIVLVLCILVYIFIATPNQVEGDSMIPTLSNKDLIITDRVSQWMGNILKDSTFSYERGDIIVFQKPGFKDFVKRIVGLPGERISIHNGRVFINEVELTEDYIYQDSTMGGNFITNDGQEILVPENRYFVLGDNRIDSLDSRYEDIGLINRDWIKGKVLLRYWPLTVFNVFENPMYNI